MTVGELLKKLKGIPKETELLIYMGNLTETATNSIK